MYSPNFCYRIFR